MTDEFNPASLLESITLPTQSLSKLSFCNSNKTAKFIQWTNELKTTQTLSTSVLLYKCLPEIAKLKTHYKTRIEMLEQVRPQVQYCVTGLTKEFLHQPVLLPKNAQKSAIVAQAIQKQLLDGYLVALKECIGKGKVKESAFEELNLLIHRAITSAGLIFYRGFQLYTTPPQNLWVILHSLYQIAFFYGLNTHSVNDLTLITRKASNIDQAYIRVLLLASCRTNQLNQTDIANIYKALEYWSEFVKLSESIDKESNNLLVVNVDSNNGPVYKDQCKPKASDTVLDIDTTKLLAMLNNKEDETIVEQNRTSGAITPNLSSFLTQHISSAWGYATKRSDNRRDINATADICLGLSDCHRVIAQGQDFKNFIQNSSQPLPLNNQTMANRFTPNSQFDSTLPEQVTSYTSDIINASQKGYCILWKDDIPTKVQAGEILLIKENGRSQWNLAVIRWIKQLKTASQIGIQIIASNPTASAIAQSYEMGGESDLMRALSVKATEGGNSIKTVITASAPFVDGSKATLLVDSQSVPIKLTKCIFATSSILQFAYRQLDQSPNGPNKSDAIKNGNKDTQKQENHETFNDSWDEND